jgi:hypothetical protein
MLRLRSARSILTIPGSCKFFEVHTDHGTNKTRFRVRDVNGQLLRGAVTLYIVAREDQLTAVSMIELDK